MNSIVISVFLVCISAAASLNLNSTTAVEGLLGANSAVTSVDLKSYMGLWYQMYADKIVINTIEKDSFCDTALYGLNGDGSVSVRNYAKIGSPTGDDYVITGYAYNDKGKEGSGELKVHFNPDEGHSVAAFDAPYWILELGPLNDGNMYDWAIVSDNLSQFLFVLARDVSVFNSQYKETVLASLESMKFTGYKKPIDIYQGSDCVYEKKQ